MANLSDIFSWFSIGKTPTADQFKQSFSSFWHKSEKIPQEQIFGLKETIESTSRGLIYQDSVQVFSELATKYPAPEPGWAAMVKSEEYIYSWNGKKWANTELKAFPDDVAVKGDLASLERDTNQRLIDVEKRATSGENVVALYVGGYVNTGTSAHDIPITYTPALIDEHKVVVIDVLPGDIYEVFSDRNGQAYCFIDSNGKQLSNGSNNTGKNEITVPSGAVKMGVTLQINSVGNWKKQSITLKTAFVDYILTNVVNATLAANEANAKATGALSEIKIITNPIVPIPRQNADENKIIPQYFKASSGNTNSPSITLVSDTESPFKDTLPFKRIFNNTRSNTVGTMYNVDSIIFGSQRPNTVTFSYWMKVADIRAIWTGNMTVYFAVAVYNYNIINLLNNPGTVQTVTITPSIPEYSKGILSASIPEIKDGYAKIVQQFEITWKDTFVGTSIPYYFIFNSLNSFYNYPLSVYNYTVLFEGINNGILIYADPNNAYPQSPQTMSVLQKQIDDLREEIEDEGVSSAPCRAKIVAENLYFASPFSATEELIRVVNILRNGRFLNNPTVNLDSTRLISKGGLITGGATLKSSGDDSCPAYFNGSYIGANHSWNQGYLLTLNNHGKTVSDVGAEYKDANGISFYIIRYVDANNLWIISENKATDGFSYSFRSPSGTLTYQNTGVNNASMVGYTATSLGNTYTFIKQNKKAVLIDGKTAYTGTDEVKCHFIDIIENYDILDIISVISLLRSNRPAGGYTTSPQLNSFNAEKLVNITITYRFLENGTTLIFQNFSTYKKIAFSFLGFIQASAISGGSKLYIPKTKAITDGAKTYNFNNIEDWTNAPAAVIHFYPAFWELPTNPPDRLVHFNNSIIFHTGYLFDRGAGLQRKNAELLTDAIFLNTTRKLYPMGIHASKPLEANQSFSCVAFRQWTKPTNNPDGRTNYGWFELGNKVFMYLDYHSSLQDVIQLPEVCRGKKITIQEKTNNVNIFGDVATSDLQVNCAIDSSNLYGYAVLIFE